MLRTCTSFIFFCSSLFYLSLFAATPLHTLNGISVNVSPAGTAYVPAICMAVNACAFEELRIIPISLSDGTPPDDSHTSLTVDCDDFSTLIVEVWGQDYNGEWSFAETYVIVEDNLGNCPGGGTERPTVIARNGLSYAINGDGQAEVHVNDLIAAYTIPAGSDEPEFAFSEDPTDTLAVFDCESPEVNVLQVYALDGDPNPSYTRTYCVLTAGVSPCDNETPDCCGKSFSVYNGWAVSMLPEQQVVLSAKDFVVSEEDTGLSYSFSSDLTDSLYVIDCTDTEEEVVLLSIWGTTSEGDQSVADTYILATNNEGYCEEIYTGPLNGNACTAYDLTAQLGNCYTYGTNISAFTQSFEPSPPLSDCEVINNWCYAPQHTVWYYFDAPASGSVNIYTRLMGTQLALWEANSCAQLTSGSAILVAANSNDQGLPAALPSLSCLIPGKRYYLAVDGQQGNTGSFELIIEEADIECLLGPNSTTCLQAGNTAPEDATITWQHFFTQSGELVGSIANYNSVLGEVTFEHQFNDGPIRTDSEGTPYLDRNWAISVESQPIEPVRLRLYFTEAELAALQTASTEVETLEDLYLTRVEGGECGPLTSGGTRYAQLESGPMSTDGHYYIDFEIPGFSAFYINGETALVISDTEEATVAEAVQLVPNPATDEVQIILPMQGGRNFEASLRNLDGKLVSRKQLASGDRLNVSNLPAGVYLLQVQRGEFVTTKRLIVR